MIAAHSVSLEFAHDGLVQPVLTDINFHLRPQESCAIIGPSGCGKTSLLFLLAGLLQPSSGSIELTGQPRCGTILQSFGLFPWKTVADKIGLGLEIQGMERAAIASRVEKMLDEMGLAGFGRHYPGQLSGGMQQRVALARALVIEPEILFMDEPLSALDALTRERLQRLILTIRQTHRLTTVLVTHSTEEAVFLGRRIIVLSRRPGRVLHILDNPGAGDIEYRQTGAYFEQCTRLRQMLREEDDGSEA